MNKNQKINSFKAYILFGFILALVYHYVLGFYFHKGYPRNTFLFDPQDYFRDFINVYIKKSSLYFPFCNLIIKLFSKISPIEVSIGLFILITLTFLIVHFYKQLHVNNILDNLSATIVFSFCTFPFLFVFDRLNFEIIVYALSVIFLFLFKQNKHFFAIIALSFAISMKLFPIMFLLLYFTESRYKYIFITLITSIVITLLSNIILGNSFEDLIINTFQNGIQYQKIYVYEDAGLDFGHSLLGLLKFVFKICHRNDIILIITKYYLYIILPILIYSIYFLKTYSILLWEKVTIITILFCLLPSVSADYKLIHFFTPIFLFINTKSEMLQKKKYFFNKIDLENIFIILFALLLLPKNYRIFTSLVYDGVYLDPIILISLYLFIVINNRKKLHNFSKIEKKYDT